MSDNRSAAAKPTLSLVVNFKTSAYPYHLSQSYNDPYSAAERLHVSRKIEGCAVPADIKDYFIFDHGHEMTVYLKDDASMIKFSAALNRSAPVSLDFIVGEQDTTNRELDRYRRSCMKAIRNTPLADKIHLTISRKEKSIVLEANTGFDFLVFDSLHERKIKPVDLGSIYKYNTLSH